MAFGIGMACLWRMVSCDSWRLMDISNWV